MKCFFSAISFILLACTSNAQQIMYRPLQQQAYGYNYNNYNRSSNNQSYYPSNPIQKTPTGYLYYPLTNLPPLQSSGYTLQNTQPYIGMYYYSPSLWLQ